MESGWLKQTDAAINNMNVSSRFKAGSKVAIRALKRTLKPAYYFVVQRLVCCKRLNVNILLGLRPADMKN